MLTSKRFYLVLFTSFFTALMFAFPRFYTTVKAIQKEDAKISAPLQLIRKTLSWSTKDKPSLSVEWTGICGTLNIAEKGDRPERRRFYMGAKLTNDTDKPMQVSSLEYLLVMDGVELASQTFGPLYNFVIPAKESRSLTTSSLIDRDVVVGVFEESIELSARCHFTEAP
jgi:hypothetical protein